MTSIIPYLDVPPEDVFLPKRGAKGDAVADLMARASILFAAEGGKKHFWILLHN